MDPDQTPETSPVQRYTDSFAAQCAHNLGAAQAELYEALNYRERLGNEAVAIGEHITKVQGYIDVLRGYVAAPATPAVTVEHDSNGDLWPTTVTTPDTSTPVEIPEEEPTQESDPVLFDTAPIPTEELAPEAPHEPEQIVGEPVQEGDSEGQPAIITDAEGNVFVGTTPPVEDTPQLEDSSTDAVPEAAAEEPAEEAIEPETRAQRRARIIAEDPTPADSASADDDSFADLRRRLAGK